MKAISKKETVIKISVGQQLVEQVDEFTYLGTLVTKDGSCAEDIREDMPWSANLERETYQLPPNLNCTKHWSYQLSCMI